MTEIKTTNGLFCVNEHNVVGLRGKKEITRLVLLVDVYHKPHHEHMENIHVALYCLEHADDHKS